jgi:TolA-binding protein
VVIRNAVILALLAVAAPFASAAPPTTCGRTDAYSLALCAYQHRDFVQAEARFTELAEANMEDPRTVRALYFLGRTEMKLGRYDEASTHFIRIYALDKPFYHAWNCDFLLGECRKASGKQ